MLKIFEKSSKNLGYNELQTPQPEINLNLSQISEEDFKNPNAAREDKSLSKDTSDIIDLDTKPVARYSSH